MPSRSAVAVSAALLCGIANSTLVAQTALPPIVSQTGALPPGLVVGRDDFVTLKWLAGVWRGKGDQQPPLYQRYRFVDDSTLVVDSYADAKLSALKGSDRYFLRNHRAVTIRGEVTWVAIKLDSTSVEFAPADNPGGTFAWKRESSNAWVSVYTELPTTDRPAKVVVYHMTRMKGK